ncbi:hypothetical protein DBR06_SOUSAS7610105, partial [Sousa chinensis]
LRIHQTGHWSWSLAQTLAYSILQLPPGPAVHIWINFLNPGSLRWCFTEG